MPGYGFGYGYGLNQAVWSESDFLIDRFPATAAYSLRALSSTTTNVVRVREDGSNTEQDFTAKEITDGTLASFCGANDGFVVTWYDQSGNARNATQSTAANQPQIVASGSVILENGKPTIQSVGLQYFSVSSFSLDVTIAYTNFYVCNLTSGLTRFFIASTKVTANRYCIGLNNSGNFQSTKRTATIVADAATYSTGQVLLSDNSVPELYKNASIGTAVTQALNNSFAVEAFSIFANTASIVAGDAVDGNAQEIVLYNTDQSTNRTAIESNINAYYNIYS